MFVNRVVGTNCQDISILVAHHQVPRHERYDRGVIWLQGDVVEPHQPVARVGERVHGVAEVVPVLQAVPEDELERPDVLQVHQELIVPLVEPGRRDLVLRVVVTKE